jgi:hypothetical protein
MNRSVESELSRIIDSAGPITGLFVILLAIGIFVIYKSMNRQMKRINPDLPLGQDDREQEADRRATEEAIERGEREDS